MLASIMRAGISLCAIAVLTASCAYQGTVVQKEVHPLPFNESLGTEGFYAFMLRDSDGQIHRQIVTPDVYASFKVGDYFNDLQPILADNTREIAPPAEGPQPLPRVPRYGPTERVQIPFQPVRAVSAPRPDSLPATYIATDAERPKTATLAAAKKTTHPHKMIAQRTTSHHHTLAKKQLAKARAKTHAAKVAASKKHKRHPQHAVVS